MSNPFSIGMRHVRNRSVVRKNLSKISSHFYGSGSWVPDPVIATHICVLSFRETNLVQAMATQSTSATPSVTQVPDASGGNGQPERMTIGTPPRAAPSQGESAGKREAPTSAPEIMAEHANNITNTTLLVICVYVNNAVNNKLGGSVSKMVCYAYLFVRRLNIKMADRHLHRQ